MATRIKLKNSTVLNKAPTTTDIEVGELALNCNADSPAAYIQDSNGAIVKIAGEGSVNEQDLQSVCNAGSTTTTGATFANTITAGNETTTGTNIYASGSAQGIVSGTQKWYLATDGDATFTGDLTINTDALFVDASAKEVGIGTASPGANLEIKPGTGAGTLLIDNASGSITDGALNIEVGSGGVLYETRKTGGLGHIWYATGAEQMRIDSSGNVGIGTSDPATKFVVSNSGAEGLEFGYTSGTNEVSSYNRDTSARAPVDIIGKTFKVLTGDPALSTGLFQDSSGRLLVGTTSAISGSAANDNLQLVDSTGSILSVASSDTTIGDGTRIGEIEFWGQPGSTWGNFASVGCFGDASAASNDNPGRLVFSTTKDGESSPTERMRIDSSGNVGIGEIAPDTTLHIDSQGATTTLKITSDTESSIDFDDHGGSAIRYKIGTNIDSNDSQFSIKDVTADSERLRIDSSGSILIGGTVTVDTSANGATSNGITSVIDNTIASTASAFSANNKNSDGYNFLGVDGGSSNEVTFTVKNDGAATFAGTVTANLFSGSLPYSDLTGAPTIPTNNNQLTNGAGYVTTTNNNQLTNGAGYVTSSAIPTNNNQLTNGAGYVTSSAIPTNNSNLTNGAGYYKSGDSAYFTALGNTPLDGSKLGANSVTFDKCAFINSNNRIYAGNDTDSTSIMAGRNTDSTYMASENRALILYHSEKSWLRISSRHSSTDPYFMQCRRNDIDRFRINAHGDVTNYSNSYGPISDIKLKTDITDATPAWDDVKALRMRNFYFKPELDIPEKQLGFIAQEVEEIFPSLVKTEEDLDNDDNPTGETTKSIKTSIIMLKAVKALQEAMERIEALEAEVKSLKDNDSIPS